MNEEYCPCCPNRCSKDELRCGRGREHFDMQNDYNDEPQTIQKQIIFDLRKCGHLLHHNRDINAEDLLSAFTEKELNTLHELLSKIQK